MTRSPRTSRPIAPPRTLALALALLAVLALAPAGAAQDAPLSPAAVEHARISIATVGGTLVATFESPDAAVRASGGILPLAERVMGRLVSDTVDATLALLNHLGADGWELVAVIDDGERREYWLKRVLP